jgi:peptidoglycan/LPS O-acetylase OafA/YrhL
MVFFTHVTHFDAHTFVEKFHFGRGLANVAVTVSLAGAFGVYLFFTLSAYLITSLLLAEKERYGRLHVRAFYVRRALRIWPLYFFVLFCGVIFQPSDLRVLPYFLLFSGNWAEVAGNIPGFFIAALWSISVEEQFYLFWPPAVRRLSPSGIRNAAILMVLAPAIALPLGFSLGLAGWRFGFMNSLSCVSAMGAGILLAVRGLIGIPRVALLVVGAACLYGGAALGLGSTPIASIAAVWLVDAFSVAILSASIGRPTTALPVYLGKISYGLYVYHPIALGLLSALLGQRLLRLPWHVVLVVSGFVATVFLAAASYRWLETPFLRLKERFAFVQSRPV